MCLLMAIGSISVINPYLFLVLVIWSNSIFVQDDTVVHEFATLCLASLSEDFLCKAQIFDNKGLPTLIQLLSSSDPDVKKNSLETISNLVQVTQNHQALGFYFM